MNLSSLAGSLGAAFLGSGVDRANSLRQAALDRGMAGQDFDRIFRLREAGWAPASDVQQALDAATQAPVTTGVLADSPPTGVMTNSSDLAHGIAANVTQNRASAATLQDSLSGKMTVPGQPEPWAQLPFDQSPAGIAVTKANTIDAARQAREQARATAVAQAAADRTNRADFGAVQTLAGVLGVADHPEVAAVLGKGYDPQYGYGKILAGLQAAAQQHATITAATAGRQQSAEGKWITVGQDPTTGQTTLYNPETNTTRVVNAVKGSLVGGSGSAPMASKEGQFGEMLKKAPDIFKAAEVLDVGAGNSAARDIAEHGLGVGGLRVPGTKGIGYLMMNSDPAYTTYQAALTPFVLANAHALSGARINKDQSDMIRNSIERQPGDFANPTVLAQRDKNVIDQLNSISGSLPADAVARQEGQLSPDLLQSLVARGYKVRGGRTGNIPGGTAAKTMSAAAYQAARQHYTDQEITAQGYTIPKGPDE